MRNVYATIDQSGLDPGDHLCFLYDHEEDCRAWALVSLHQSLINGEKILYILDSAETQAAFQRSWGTLPETQAAIQRGRLQLIDLRGQQDWRGSWQRPQDFLGCFQNEVEAARREGYSMVRVAVNMTSAASLVETPHQLIQYETSLDQIICQQPFAMVCEYSRSELPYEVQLNLVVHHRLLVVSGGVHENFYYIPSEEWFSVTHPDVV
jgi:hypothetical protein